MLQAERKRQSQVVLSSAKVSQICTPIKLDSITSNLTKIAHDSL
jgi:hypothetical protein